MPFEDDADVLSFRVEVGIAVVSHVSRYTGVDGVVSTLAQSQLRNAIGDAVMASITI